MLTKSNFFLFIILCFTGGVALRSFLNIGFVFTLFLFFLSFVFLLFWLSSSKRNFLWIMVALFSISFGVLRFDVADSIRGDSLLDTFVGKAVTVEAVIVNEPDERENNTYLTVEFKNIFIGDKKFSAGSRAKIITDLYSVYRYGDYLLIKGKLAKPKNFTGDTGVKNFDYISYLSKDGIFYQIFYPKIKLIERDKGNFIKEKLFIFKHAFLNNVSRVIPEPASSLLGGLVVGAKQSLGNKLLDDFRSVGIIHIVVLSGYNVTIVAEALMNFFSFLPRVFSILLGSVSIILFTIITGAGATIVRASVMALFVIIARATGRTSEITRALFIAGFFMMLFNPKILIFDSSFQLSFLATLGLILFPPFLEKYFRFVPTRFQLREFALATVSTQIFVLPLLLYKMGQLSLVALPVNLLVLMFIPLTMLFGFLTGIVGFLSIALSIPFAFLAYGLLAYELKIVEIFASLPFASVQIESFPLWLMLGMYGLYAWIIYKFWNKTLHGSLMSK